MEVCHPYRSPTGDVSVRKRRTTLSAMLAALLVFVFVSFTSFGVLITTLFAESTEIWAGCAAAGTAVTVALATLYFAATADLLHGFGQKVLVASVASAVLPLTVILACQYDPEVAGALLFPRSAEQLVRGHWVLAFSSTIGTIYSISGCCLGGRAREARQRVAVLLCAACGLLSAGYLIINAMRLITQ